MRSIGDIHHAIYERETGTLVLRERIKSNTARGKSYLLRPIELFRPVNQAQCVQALMKA